MATANSAQREPSMEEILASIRRIIEDSDGGRRPGTDVIEAAAAIEAVEDDVAIGAVAPEVEVFRAELRADNAAGAEPKKPISLAEVQAQLAAAQPATTVSELASASEPPFARPTVIAEESRNTSGPSAQDTAASVIEKKTERQRSDETTAEAAFAIAEPAAALADDPAEPEVAFDASDLDLDDEPAVQGTAPRPALVSEETSRQVAAAFGELSEAFASRSRKSFDEMAEEMLRPMLQDWLDNNLPTLVERLVREEIERVARGGA